jgi:hypothetical protein
MSTLTFEDIKSRRLAGNWNVLNDLIDHKGFPPGYIVGRRRCFVKIAESDKATDAARVSACVALLDRGWGKPDKTHHHDGDIRQHIISDRPLTLDEWTATYCRV